MKSLLKGRGGGGDDEGGEEAGCVAPTPAAVDDDDDETERLKQEAEDAKERELRLQQRAFKLKEKLKRRTARRRQLEEESKEREDELTQQVVRLKDKLRRRAAKRKQKEGDSLSSPHGDGADEAAASLSPPPRKARKVLADDDVSTEGEAGADVLPASL
jgi:hypothetical protein